MNILIVGGMMQDMSNLRAVMGLGHEVWLAPASKAADRLFRQFNPDAVVLMARDLDPSYPQLVHDFRKQAGQRHLTLLALAPFTHLKIIQQVLDWGVDAFLTSPCDMVRVKKRLLSLREDERTDRLALR